MKILAIKHDPPDVRADQFTPENYTPKRSGHGNSPGRRHPRIVLPADRNEAVLVLECADVDEARSVLNTLPLVCEGLIGFALIPLSAYPGFARLFNINA